MVAVQAPPWLLISSFRYDAAVTSPFNVNLQVKGVEKLFDIIKSYFGMRMMKATAQQKADALVIEAEAKRKVKLLAAQTKVDIELIETTAEIEQKKAEVEGKHELAALRKQLKAKDAPPPEDEIIVDIDDFLVEPAPAEIVVQGGQGNPYEYVEQKRFKNTKKVLNETLKALPEHAEVSDEPVEPGWYARFFDGVKDISDEDLQKFWGKLLAGEIARPGRFSLRTLDVLRNISIAEAHLFERACKVCQDSGEIMLPDDRLNYRSFYPYIDPYQGTLLECGLLTSEATPGIKLQIQVGGEGSFHTCQFGRRTVVIRSASSQSLVRHSLRLTTAGHQLRSLIKPEPDDGFLAVFCKAIEAQGMTTEIVDDFDIATYIQRHFARSH